MEQWPQKCRIEVGGGPSAGATHFAFHNGRLPLQMMEVSATTWKEITEALLPHEITHTVLAYHFRQPLPRWLDEGGAILEENDAERDRHDMIAEGMVQSGEIVPLNYLFGVMQYPEADLARFYSEGYSVTSYLVGLRDRPAFVRFVDQALASDWSTALRTCYRINSVDDLQQHWVDYCFKRRRQRMQGQKPSGGRGGIAIGGGIGIAGGIAIGPSMPTVPVQPSPIPGGPGTGGAINPAPQPGPDLSGQLAQVLAKIDSMQVIITDLQNRPGVPGPQGPAGKAGATGQQGLQGPQGEPGKPTDQSIIVNLESRITAIEQKIQTLGQGGSSVEKSRIEPVKQ